MAVVAIGLLFSADGIWGVVLVMKLIGAAGELGMAEKLRTLVRRGAGVVAERGGLRSGQGGDASDAGAAGRRRRPRGRGVRPVDREPSVPVRRARQRSQRRGDDGAGAGRPGPS